MPLAAIKAAIRAPVFQFYRLQMKKRAADLRFLFIISHMRSGSTLLLHILASHPEITGFGEMHQSYHSESDLQRLACFVKYTKRELLIKEKYIMDKMVQENNTIADGFLEDRKTHYIFLTRDGREALPSMVKMYRRGSVEGRDQDWCADYMVDRCRTIVSLSERIPDRQRKFYVSNDDLLNRTEDVLRCLQTFLNLKTPLSEDYKLMNTTGTVGVGDPSPYIKQGKIVRSREKRPIELPEEIIQKSQEATEECERRLRECCSHIGEPV